MYFAIHYWTQCSFASYPLVCQSRRQTNPFILFYISPSTRENASTRSARSALHSPFNCFHSIFPFLLSRFVYSLVYTHNFFSFVYSLLLLLLLLRVKIGVLLCERASERSAPEIARSLLRSRSPFFDLFGYFFYLAFRISHIHITTTVVFISPAAACLSLSLYCALLSMVKARTYTSTRAMLLLLSFIRCANENVWTSFTIFIGHRIDRK